MNDRIKDYFSFNKKEQRGLIILLVLMLLSVSINIFMPEFIPQKEFDITPFKMEVAEFLASVDKLDSLNDAAPKRYSNYQKEEDKAGPFLSPFKASPFYFDPNELSEEEWMSMGMDPKIIRNIIHYREKGGTFRDKEGFRKIYGMDDSIFAVLDPYIRLKQKEISSPPVFKSNNEKKDSIKPFNNFKKYIQDTVMVDLNSADSASLLALNGIGPSFAGRIIRYRERLGGFIIPEQLLEVNGMDSIRYKQFRDQVIIDQQFIRKIDLNKVTFKELLRHPYFEYYLVKAVFNYKEEIKAFDSVGQLRMVPVMYEELFEKIAPYLEVK